MMERCSQVLILSSLYTTFDQAHLTLQEDVRTETAKVMNHNGRDDEERKRAET